MRVTWLTQSGLLFENSRARIMVDPYLADTMGQLNERKKRKIPVDKSFYEAHPDIILITHAHIDHCNPETLQILLCNEMERSVTVLASEGAYEKLMEMVIPAHHNIILVSPHTVWSERGITFYAVHAEHSDRTAVGFIIDDGKKTYYISGDTLYNYDVIDDVLDLVEDGVDYAFLPINGRGNNMNAKDAADFAYEIDAKQAIPTHYGLIDEIDPTDFDFDDRIILTPYEAFEL